MKGRFASEAETGDEMDEVLKEKTSERPLRPMHCRSFARRRMAEAYPEIVDRFIREAKQGSIAHAKALAALSGLDRPEAAQPGPALKGRARRRSSLTKMLMDELRRGREAEGTSSSGV